MTDLSQTFTPVGIPTMRVLSDAEVISFALTHGRPHPYDGYRQTQLNWARETIDTRTNLTPFKVIVACRVIEALTDYEEERHAAAVIRAGQEKVASRFCELRAQSELEPRRSWIGRLLAGWFA